MIRKILIEMDIYFYLMKKCNCIYDNTSYLKEEIL